MGLKDQIVGKLSKNPDKVEHGREQRSGELKQKEFEDSEVRSVCKRRESSRMSNIQRTEIRSIRQRRRR